MGMYDDIIVTLPCQQCGGDVTGFQSKDGPCELEELTPAELFAWAGSYARFYTPCDACDYWNEWTFKTPPPAPPIIIPAPREVWS